MVRISDVRNIPGVYLLIGLNGEPLYTGQSKKLRTRLEHHFIRQNSSASQRQAKPAHGTCRLTLTINGTSYAVRPNPADSFAAVKAFRLRKADGTTYDATQTIHGVECDCPDFIFHREGIGGAGCKHVKALVARGLLDREGGVR
jgi:hypothetical protein